MVDFEGCAYGRNGLPVHEDDVQIVFHRAALTRNSHGLLGVVVEVNARVEFSEKLPVFVNIN